MLQIYQLIACLQSSVNQQGLLADMKREGRCSDDYFFFTVCVKHFSGFIEALIRGEYTPNTNMADHSVGTRDEFHESEASEASVFCFYNASPEKSCFVDGLV